MADMTLEEREQLYGVIAERLAVIGDSYENDKKDLAGKVEDACPLPRFSLTSGRNPDGKGIKPFIASKPCFFHLLIFFQNHLFE